MTISLQDDIQVTTLVDFTEKTIEFNQIGLFTTTTVERKNDSTISVTAYDFMHKFAVVVDKWNASIKYPITAGAMLKSLCDYVKIPLATPTFLNSDFSIKKNYKGENVTGVQVVQWIAQLAACFAVVDEAGKLHIRWYKETGYKINEDFYMTVNIAEFQTAPVDKLQIFVRCYSLYNGV